MSTQFSEQQVETPEEETSAKDPIGALFGPPPLIEGETEETYETFAAQVRAAVGPIDAIEEIFVRDVVDLMWDVLRLRRLKGKYLQSIKKDGLESIIPMFFEGYPREYIDSWARREPEALETVNSLLIQAGLDMEHVIALALAKNAATIERMDRLIAAAEGRRNQSLRELERHRESLARRVQTATQAIEDAEFRVVEPALEAPQCD